MPLVLLSLSPYDLDMVTLDIPQAWRPVVEPALQELEALGVRVRECKDKWGELRIYIGTDTPPELAAQAREIIERAATSCDMLCYECGAPATNERGSKRVCRTHQSATPKPS